MSNESAYCLREYMTNNGLDFNSYLVGSYVSRLSKMTEKELRAEVKYWSVQRHRRGYKDVL